MGERSRPMKMRTLLPLILTLCLLLSGCESQSGRSMTSDSGNSTGGDEPQSSEELSSSKTSAENPTETKPQNLGNVTVGTETYRGFVIDNVYHFQNDGDLEVLVESRTPVYLAIGEDDEYYGSEPTKRAYDTLRGLYEKQGLSEAEIGELLVLDVKEDSYFRDKGMNNQHGGGFSSVAPVAFSLKAVEQIENDTLWLRYTSKIRRTT